VSGIDISNLSIVLPGTSLADECVDITLGVASNNINVFPFRVNFFTLLFVVPAVYDWEANVVLQPRPFAIFA
jgi:hypothetical protein